MQLGSASNHSSTVDKWLLLKDHKLMSKSSTITDTFTGIVIISKGTNYLWIPCDPLLEGSFIQSWADCDALLQSRQFYAEATSPLNNHGAVSSLSAWKDLLFLALLLTKKPDCFPFNKWLSSRIRSHQVGGSSRICSVLQKGNVFISLYF